MGFCTSLWIRGTTKQHSSSVGGSLTPVPGQKQTPRSCGQSPTASPGWEMVSMCLERKHPEKSSSLWWYCSRAASPSPGHGGGDRTVGVSLPLKSAVLHPGNTIGLLTTKNLVCYYFLQYPSLWAGWPKYRGWLAQRGAIFMFHSV